MSITSTKREKHPLRFLRKDARTRIYRELFGVQHRQGTSNDPWQDSTRERAGNWEYGRAAEIFSQNKDDAGFTPQQIALCEARLDTLKRVKS